jgi:hypothetical protein
VCGFRRESRAGRRWLEWFPVSECQPGAEELRVGIVSGLRCNVEGLDLALQDSADGAAELKGSG